ncbi:MAG: preprotein translocase subunit SecE [Bacteroidaceae bacterium]|nr:preprotein translocase subunit SecE [Bacteroidaceae bacterium]
MLKKFVTYCKDSYTELAHKTTWPTRAELTHNAIVVLVASIIIALAVFFVDLFFEWGLAGIYSL